MGSLPIRGTINPTVSGLEKRLYEMFHHAPAFPTHGGVTGHVDAAFAFEHKPVSDHGHEIGC